MARAQWTDDFLERQRQVGDPVADDTIRTVYANRHIDELHEFMGQIVSNSQIPSELPDDIHAFLAKTSALPPWADHRRLTAGAELFDIWGPVTLATLVCASLPECYTMRTGVRILEMTTQLGVHTNRRLHQTATMVMSVMTKGAFGPKGDGTRQTQKVRLIHAGLRYRILSAIGTAGVPAGPGDTNPVLFEGAVRSVADVIARDGFDWQVARDGVPINQEDLAFTLLTFGHVIPQGMRTLGVKLSKEDYDAFLHCWNVSGYILGVNEDLMAHNEEEATELFARIKARQAGPSPGAAHLTHSILDVVEEKIFKWRIFHPIAPIVMRMLVGDDTAGMLGLDLRHPGFVGALHRVVARLLRKLQTMLGPLAQPLQPLAPITAYVGRRIMKHFYIKTNNGNTKMVEPGADLS